MAAHQESLQTAPLLLPSARETARCFSADMSQQPRQQFFEAAELQPYLDFSDAGPMFLSNDWGIWQGVAGPNAFNLDVPSTLPRDEYSLTVEGNGIETIPTEDLGNVGIPVLNEYQPSSQRSFWTTDISPEGQWSSDAIALMQSVDSGFPAIINSAENLATVPSDRGNLFPFEIDNGSSCWPRATSPEPANVSSTFNGTISRTAPTAMRRNALEGPAEGDNISVRQEVSTLTVTTSRPKHIEYDAVSAARNSSVEAEDVEHGPSESNSRLVCLQCRAVYKARNSLEWHGWKESHTVYGCKCGKGFTRIDDLRRHLKNFRPESAKHPCPHCRRHRGEKAFKRKDHLEQHLRNYHHIGLEVRSHWNFLRFCPYTECPEYRDKGLFRSLGQTEWEKQMPFSSTSAHTKHMREVHNESPYPCDVAHCPKIGGKGYFRKKDMLKHRKRDHPDAPEYNDPEKTIIGVTDNQLQGGAGGLLV
ncbi:hypothetical protein MMC11_005561 [Xylographa trunciseda]|nr:hypothetical protein [Xylographa trunciseda]